MPHLTGSFFGEHPTHSSRLVQPVQARSVTAHILVYLEILKGPGTGAGKLKTMHALLAACKYWRMMLRSMDVVKKGFLRSSNATRQP